MDDKNITFDGNHLFAGKELLYKIKIIDVADTELIQNKVIGRISISALPKIKPQFRLNDTLTIISSLIFFSMHYIISQL